MTSVAIIGGGAAGFFAACNIKRADVDIDIDIYEKNLPLQKLLTTGNGRCNLSNEIYDFKELASNYPRGEKFLYSVFSKFGVGDTIGWFYDKGLETYTQDDNRMFPKSDSAKTVKELLLDVAKKNNVNIIRSYPVNKIEKQDGKFLINKKIYDKVIIATGGSKNKANYEFIKKLGHKIIDLKPALCACVLDKPRQELAGISMKNIKISAHYEDKEIYSGFGDMIFTHKGISGPAVFSASSYLAYEDMPLNMSIDFIPEINNIEEELINILNKESKKDIGNILKIYIPKSLTYELLKINKIPADKKASQISKDDRKKIVKFLKNYQMVATSTVADGEMVTAGGVDLKEINPKTMESKIVDNLYFCGEVLDIDGLTGGFNLQACWSTGYIAASSI